MLKVLTKLFPQFTKILIPTITPHHGNNLSINTCKKENVIFSNYISV